MSIGPLETGIRCSRRSACLENRNHVGAVLALVQVIRPGLHHFTALRQMRQKHKKPAFYAGLVEVLGCFRMLSDDPNGGAGGNRTPVHKSYATRSTYVAASIVLAAH